MSDNMEFMNDTSGDVEDLDELLGAYALDAVDEDERRRVDDYLAVNPRAAAEVQEHREVATLLAFSGQDAPPDLWSRIEVELEGGAPPAPGPELAKVLTLDPPSVAAPEVSGTSPTVESGTHDELAARRKRRWSSIGPWIGGAAAAVAVVAVAVSLLGDPAAAPSDPIADAYAAAIDDRDSLVAELVSDASEATAQGVIDQDGHGYLDAGTLPTLDASLTYQLWGVLGDTGDVVSLGILGPNPELETFTVEGEVVALAVTIEQAPGVISDGNPVGAFVGELA